MVRLAKMAYTATSEKGTRFFDVYLNGTRSHQIQQTFPPGESNRIAGVKENKRRQ